MSMTCDSSYAYLWFVTKILETFFAKNTQEHSCEDL